ncbi:DUF5676 family membrane protein [Bythopirellula goksoeyrii]|uniref:Uncharacterized protein n=1 Tax=Bythopirellula goksoeyrii TaxID=1400387 RepID=A0A5B9QE79_9BACT|nr:DUF5676 family membrane protein [Bythopirellula goksoeyrii]QEG35802.1 hypothetical protein Pr1d_31080 [Bythopirellula goksoeyrii]
MQTISIKQLGFALGATAALLYFGCVFVMLTVPHDMTIRFFNSLLHGWDVTSIMRWDMPWWEAITGVLETFILAWLVGAVVALFYNLGNNSRHCETSARTSEVNQ